VVKLGHFSKFRTIFFCTKPSVTSPAILPMGYYVVITSATDQRDPFVAIGIGKSSELLRHILTWNGTSGNEEHKNYEPVGTDCSQTTPEKLGWLFHQNRSDPSNEPAFKDWALLRSAVQVLASQVSHNRPLARNPCNVRFRGQSEPSLAALRMSGNSQRRTLSRVKCETRWIIDQR